jgi:hypothetical protein
MGNTLSSKTTPDQPAECSEADKMLTEGDALVLLDAKLRADPDSWPEFTLNQVKVISQATGELVSLLTAHAAAEVRVEGVLEEVGEDKVKLRKYHTLRCL